MKRIFGTVNDLETVVITDPDVKEKVREYLTVLDDNYEADRNIFEDDGGFAIVIEDEADLNDSEEYINLEEDIYEYIEVVNEDYISALKLCNNEFTIMLYVKKILCPKEIMEGL